MEFKNPQELMAYINNPANYRQTRKKKYTIWCCRPPIGTKVVNKLEKIGYETNQDAQFILSGTCGELWNIKIGKLASTYTLENGRPITPETLKPLMQKDGTIPWFKVTASATPAVWACFVPKRYNFPFQTSWGSMACNDPSVYHADGDFIVRTDEGGKPSANDAYVVNGKVFLGTYDMRPFSHYGFDVSTLTLGVPDKPAPLGGSQIAIRDAVWNGFYKTLSSMGLVKGRYKISYDENPLLSKSRDSFAKQKLDDFKNKFYKAMIGYYTSGKYTSEEGHNGKYTADDLLRMSQSTARAFAWYASVFEKYIKRTFAGALSAGTIKYERNFFDWGSAGVYGVAGSHAFAIKYAFVSKSGAFWELTVALVVSPEETIPLSELWCWGEFVCNYASSDETHDNEKLFEGIDTDNPAALGHVHIRDPRIAQSIELSMENRFKALSTKLADLDKYFAQRLDKECIARFKHNWATEF